MSLDIRFTSYEGVICPHCGEVVGRKEIDCVDSGGRGWYPILKKLGYYVPYEQRTEENDWYGKDMTLTVEQVGKVRQFVRDNSGLYNSREILVLTDAALLDDNKVVVNADW